MQRRVEDKRRGRGSARVEDRGSESFPRHASFLTTMKLFLRLPVTGAPLFEFSPHPSHLTRVLSVPTLLAPLHPCVTSTQLLLPRVSPKKKKNGVIDPLEVFFGRLSNESLLELIIVVRNDQHGFIHSGLNSKYENI